MSMSAHTEDEVSNRRVARAPHAASASSDKSTSPPQTPLKTSKSSFGSSASQLEAHSEPSKSRATGMTHARAAFSEQEGSSALTSPQRRRSYASPTPPSEHESAPRSKVSVSQELDDLGEFDARVQEEAEEGTLSDEQRGSSEDEVDSATGAAEEELDEESVYKEHEEEDSDAGSVRKESADSGSERSGSEEMDRKRSGRAKSTRLSGGPDARYFTLYRDKNIDIDQPRQLRGGSAFKEEGEYALPWTAGGNLTRQGRMKEEHQIREAKRKQKAERAARWAAKREKENDDLATDDEDRRRRRSRSAKGYELRDVKPPNYEMKCMPDGRLKDRRERAAEEHEATVRQKSRNSKHITIEVGTSDEEASQEDEKEQESEDESAVRPRQAKRDMAATRGVEHEPKRKKSRATSAKASGSRKSLKHIEESEPDSPPRNRCEPASDIEESENSESDNSRTSHGSEKVVQLKDNGSIPPCAKRAGASAKSTKAYKTVPRASTQPRRQQKQNTSTGRQKKKDNSTKKSSKSAASASRSSNSRKQQNEVADVTDSEREAEQSLAQNINDHVEENMDLYDDDGYLPLQNDDEILPQCKPSPCPAADDLPGSSSLLPHSASCSPDSPSGAGATEQRHSSRFTDRDGNVEMGSEDEESKELGEQIVQSQLHEDRLRNEVKAAQRREEEARLALEQAKTESEKRRMLWLDQADETVLLLRRRERREGSRRSQASARVKQEVVAREPDAASSPASRAPASHAERSQTGSAPRTASSSLAAPNALSSNAHSTSGRLSNSARTTGEDEETSHDRASQPAREKSEEMTSASQVVALAQACKELQAPPAPSASFPDSGKLSSSHNASRSSSSSRAPLTNISNEASEPSSSAGPNLPWSSLAPGSTAASSFKPLTHPPAAQPAPQSRAAQKTKRSADPDSGSEAHLASRSPGTKRRRTSTQATSSSVVTALGSPAAPPPASLATPTRFPSPGGSGTEDSSEVAA